jgi:hypothetical protein
LDCSEILILGASVSYRVAFNKRAFFEYGKTPSFDAAKYPVQNLSNCWGVTALLIIPDIRASRSIGHLGLKPAIHRTLHESPVSRFRSMSRHKSQNHLTFNTSAVRLFHRNAGPCDQTVSEWRTPLRTGVT